MLGSGRSTAGAFASPRRIAGSSCLCGSGGSCSPLASSPEPAVWGKHKLVPAQDRDRGPPRAAALRMKRSTSASVYPPARYRHSGSRKAQRRLTCCPILARKKTNRASRDAVACFPDDIRWVVTCLGNGRAPNFPLESSYRWRCLFQRCRRSAGSAWRRPGRDLRTRWSPYPRYRM